MKKTKLIIMILCISILSINIGVFIWGDTLSRNLKEYSEQVSYQYDEKEEITNSSIVNINNVADWFHLCESVSNGQTYSNSLVSLNVDLDFKNYECIPIGSYSNPFQGTFLGNGHILKNFKISSGEEFVGVFGYTKDAKIIEVVIERGEVYSEKALGTGGIVGYADGGIIKDCIFEGKIEAKEGSIGGIVGNNWSYIDSCQAYGEVRGNSTSGYYGKGDNCQNFFGSGGIAGSNGATISHCINWSEVNINYEGSCNAGGITEYNTGLIESCTNLGKVHGGGIVKTNDKFSSIRGCFNFGEVHAGIACSSYQNSIIEQCINYGEASRQYAADIVSSWTQEDDNNWGMVTGCLYTNTSRNGVTRDMYFDTNAIKYNYHIQNLSFSEKNELIRYLEENEYEEAYKWVVEKELRCRKRVFVGTAIGIPLILLIVKIIGVLNGNIKQKKIYRVAKNALYNEEYQIAFKTFSQILDFKDSSFQARHCIIKYLKKCTIKGVFEIGMYEGKVIQWKCIYKNKNEYRLVSTNALAVECINLDELPICWKNSHLYKKLNGFFRDMWFNSIEQSLLVNDISILTIDEVEHFIQDEEFRKCKAIDNWENVLSSGRNVYWWIRHKEDKKIEKMPFVTSEGLISERGLSITSTNIAVRPVITIRISDENSY